MVYHLEGLSGEVYLHLLANDGIEMKGLLVLLAPLGVVLTELPVGVELDVPVTALLGIAVPQHYQGHVLPGRHILCDTGRKQCRKEGKDDRKVRILFLQFPSLLDDFLSTFHVSLEL